MFIGHYAAAFAAKAIEPRAPLWTYIAAAQLVDIGWAALVIGGVEQVRIDPSLAGTPLDLHHMPWTHSLPAAVVWSLAAALLSGAVLKLPRRAALAIGLVVFSHWLLDLLVHRPDLALWPGGQKVGFALWDMPVLEATVEMGLLGLAAAAWTARRPAHARLTPALAFIAVLVALQCLPLLMPAPTDPAMLAANMLVLFIAVTALAALVDRPSHLHAARERPA